MASFLRPCALLSLALCALSSPVANDAGLRSTDDPLRNGGQLFARAACKDNLGRCLNPTGTKPTDIASRSAATAFCSSFLSIPIVTSAIDTTTPVTLITVTATVTASTEVQTETEVSSVEATETSQTTVTTILSLGEVPAKRAVPTAALPNCAAAGSYSPAQLSSACACVSVTPSTTYVTATAPVATNTALETSSVTITTVTVTTSTITTGTETVIATATATLTPSPPAPLCRDAENPFVANGKTYTKYCDQYYYPGRNIGASSNVLSFSDCVDVCSATPGCVYAYWVSPTSRYGDKLLCYTFNEFDSNGLHPDAGVDSFSLNV